MRNTKMRVITPEGVHVVEIPDRTHRSLLGGHANAVGHFLARGDTSVLAPYEGIEIMGHRLLTDPDALEAWAASGELEFQDLYDASGMS